MAVAGLALILVFSGCRKTTIKLKKVDGVWKLVSMTATQNTITNIDISYSGTGCPADASTTVTDDIVNAISGSTFSIDIDHDADGSINDYSSSDDMTLTVDLTINEDGTYTVTMTYSYTDAGGDTYSGSTTTTLNHWYMGESNENNSNIVFQEFPVIDFGSIAQGNIVYQDQIMYFDQEATDKDNMAVTFSTTVHEVRTEEEDLGCVITTVTDVNSTLTGTSTLTRQE